MWADQERACRGCYMGQVCYILLLLVIECLDWAQVMSGTDEDLSNDTMKRMEINTSLVSQYIIQSRAFIFLLLNFV
eukprot:m.108117 g.108117  ORF g.108117 m.108117 type:complete len:76 (+) comp13336_c0_seq5:350-577(+)